MLQQRAEKLLIVQDQVARFHVREQLHQHVMILRGFGQGRGDKIEVLRGELNPAIRLNQLHRPWAFGLLLVRFDFKHETFQ